MSPCGLPAALQERLGRQQRDMEEERSRLQEVIAKMEARLSEQSRLLEQVGLPSGAGPALPQHPRECQQYAVLGLLTSLCSLSRPLPPPLSPSRPISCTSHFPSCHRNASRQLTPMTVGEMLSPPELCRYIPTSLRSFHIEKQALLLGK